MVDRSLAENFEIVALPAGFADDPFPVYRALLEHMPLKRFSDGSVMLSLFVPGVSFETADTVELNAHTATREVLLRSSLDARFVLYHHVIRRRVHVELDAEFDMRALLPGAWWD